MEAPWPETSLLVKQSTATSPLLVTYESDGEAAEFFAQRLAMTLTGAEETCCTAVLSGADPIEEARTLKTIRQAMQRVRSRMT